MANTIKKLSLVFFLCTIAIMGRAQNTKDTTTKVTDTTSIFQKRILDRVIKNTRGTADTTIAIDSTKLAADTTKIKDTIKVAVQPPPPPARKPLPQVHKPKGPKPVTQEVSFGPKLNSNGWGVMVDYGKIKTDDDKHRDMFYNIKLLQFEFDEKKSPKQIKSNALDASSIYSVPKSKPYIYGKINNFYTIKLGYGFRKMIAGKPDPGTVSLHWIGAGGLSIGLLKPYYLNAGGQQIKYSDSTKNTFLTQSDISGAAGFGKGLGEMKIIPGLHVKSGLHLDFSKNRKTVLAVETGIDAEIYTKDIPIMANQTATPYFVDAYLVFEFGRRW